MNYFGTSSWNGIKSTRGHIVNLAILLALVFSSSSMTVREGWAVTALPSPEDDAMMIPELPPPPAPPQAIIHPHAPVHSTASSSRNPSSVEKPVAAEDPSLAEPPKGDFEEVPDTEIFPYDPELDEGSSPNPGTETTQPNAAPSEENPEETKDQQDMRAIIAEDSQPIEHQMNWINLGLGLVRGSTPLGLPYFFSAANVKYARTIKNIIFFKNAKVQDSLAIEVGAYFLKAINFAAEGDAYNAINGLAALRYDLLLSESLRLFAYGGVIQGFLISSNAPQVAAVLSLTLLQPAAGGGLLFQMGPGWYTRLEVGLEALGFGLSLKF